MFIGGAIWGGIQVLREGTSTWPKRSFYALAGVSFLVLIGIMLMTFDGFLGLMTTLIESREEIFRPFIGRADGEAAQITFPGDIIAWITTDTALVIGGIALLAFALYREQKKG
jgi:hypothetical protein